MMYNQLRANIRNAMVGMDLAEARLYRQHIIDDRGKYNARVDYADEFIRELEPTITL